MEIGYSRDDGNTRDSSGERTSTHSSVFTQRYRLTLKKSFFPHLTLTAGGLFQQEKSDLESGGEETTSTVTKTRPFFDLRLTSPLYQAGVGYSKREEKQKTSGVPSSTDVNEEYHAILGWKPEGLPEWDLRLERTDTFDKARIFQDTTTDHALMTVHYAYEGLELRYQPSYRDVVNRIDDIEIKELSHNGRSTYSGSFFRNRVALSANYEIVRTGTEIIASGGGEVSFPLFPLFGLSSIEDTPADGTLDPNPALIDGNLAASAGVNLGLPPPGGDARPRNLGLDFVNATEANTLYLWVDRELPAEIADAFSWEVYTSPDNLNWTLVTTVFLAPFGPFQNRFEIRFPIVTARFLKVVTRPLSIAVPGAVGFPDIFVTELQPFLRRPAEEARGKTNRTTQNGNADIRTRLLDRPSLYHEFSFFFIDPGSSSSQRRYSVTNGLSVSHRFSRIFSAGGRVTREDINEPDESGVVYTYTASLLAVPLKTLRHVLLFNGRDERLGEVSQDRYFLSLRNTARLYRGIDVFFAGGIGRTESGTGEKQDITNLNFGASVVPHRTMTLTLNFNGTTTDRTGGGMPDRTTQDRRGDLSLAFRPFDTLYILASVSKVEQDDRKETLQNYAVNWSPFPSGALQFIFAFNQDLTTIDDGKSRFIRPSLRWNVTNRIILDLAYQFLTTESSVQRTENRTFSTNLQIYY